MYNLILFLVLNWISRSHQHYFIPPDCCAMAAVCTHDDQEICAATPSGCKRTFLDKCDMYEYNCDNWTNFDCEDNCKCEDSDPPTMETLPEVTSSVPSEKPTAAVPRMFDCDDPNCMRPKTWMTTERGETRDFYRILLTGAPQLRRASNQAGYKVNTEHMTGQMANDRNIGVGVELHNDAQHLEGVGINPQVQKRCNSCSA